MQNNKNMPPESAQQACLSCAQATLRMKWLQSLHTVLRKQNNKRTPKPNKKKTKHQPNHIV